MRRLRLPIVLFALVGVVAGCLEEGIGGGDLLSYKVTVTNAGAVAATISIVMPDGGKTAQLPPGVSAAAIGYKPGKYTVTIQDVGDVKVYREGLIKLRNELQAQADTGTGDVATLLSQVNLIKQQLRTLQSSPKSVGCSGEVTKLQPYKIASAAFQPAGQGGGIWIPTCG